MSKWYFIVTRPDGTKYDVGPYDSESESDTASSDYSTENPADVVGSPVEQNDDYVALAPVSETYKADGTRDIVYNDGTIVNVS